MYDTRYNSKCTLEIDMMCQKYSGEELNGGFHPHSSQGQFILSANNQLTVVGERKCYLSLGN